MSRDRAATWTLPTTLDQDTLHAAVAALAQIAHDQLDQPTQVFVRPEGQVDSWLPQDFKKALQDAAAGHTDGLRRGIFGDLAVSPWPSPFSRFSCEGPDPLQAVFCLWQELLAAVAMAGHVHLLKAMEAANPDLFRSCDSVHKVAAGLEGCGLEILQWLWALPTLSKANGRGGRYHLPVVGEVPAIAARCGQLTTLQWLQRPNFCGSGWDSAECAKLVAPTAAWQQLQATPPEHMHAEFGAAALCTLAAEMQDLGTLRKLLLAKPPCPFDAQTGAALARHGHTGALRELRLMLPDDPAASLFWSELGEVSALSAAQAGQLDTLQWLWGQCAPSEDQPARPKSAAPCSIRGVWPPRPEPAHSSCEPADSAMYVPAVYQPPDKASWALDIAKAALQGGHAGVLEWMWDKCPDHFWRHEACQFAALQQTKSGLRWLLARTPPCVWEPDLSRQEKLQSGYAINMRTAWGALEHHSQLPSPGLLGEIPMDPFACRMAAATDNMELMVWLRSHGCPWDARACSVAARHGHLGMLKWLRGQQPPCDWVPHTSFLAAQHDQPDTLQWLLDQGCPPPSRPELASDRCLAILVEHGCPLTHAAMERAGALGIRPHA